MTKQLKIESSKVSKFELVLQIRDNNGNPTGKTKSFVTDDAEELDKYWQRNNDVKKGKKKKDIKTPTDKQSE